MFSLELPDTISNEEILRLAIIAELDAISLYEKMSEKTKNSGLKKLLLDISKEEKTHVGEFLKLLEEKDKEQKDELENGAEEAENIIKMF